MHKYINILIFIAALSISFYILDHMNLKTSAQNNNIGSKSNIVITINPGAIDTNSQSPVTPKDITIPIGTTIIWLNKDSSPHLIASGTPDKGPTNIFYGNYFESGQAYNVTLDKAGIYGYYDPGSPNINGSITVVEGNNLFSGSEVQTLQSPSGNSINNNNNNGVFSSPPPQQQQQPPQKQSQTGGGGSSSVIGSIENINNNSNMISNSINNNNNNPSATQSNIPIGNNFIISGPVISFLSTPSGNWVVNGSWALKVQNGNLSFFRGFMQWDPTNITKLPHTHSFVNFRVNPSSQNNNNIHLGTDRVIDIKGMMDIGANNKIEWTHVPAEIKTAGNTITVLILDDSMTGYHFNNYPVFGKIANVEKCSDNGEFGANMDYDPTIAKCSL